MSSQGGGGRGEQQQQQRQQRGRRRRRPVPLLLLLLASSVASVVVAGRSNPPPAFRHPPLSSGSSSTHYWHGSRNRPALAEAASAQSPLWLVALAAAAGTSGGGDGGRSDPPPPPPPAAAAAAPQMNKEGLERAFGKGKGKHQRASTPKKRNKYAAFSKVEGKVDPLEAALREVEGKIDPLEAALREAALANDPSLARREAEEARRKEERVRGDVEYPSVQEIDPYEPNTFGFIEAGIVLGAHGVDGAVRVRATSDVAEEALGQPGMRHVKGPRRRYPRPLPVLEARPTVDDVYLLRFEGVEDREAAAALRDFKVYLREAERPALEEDEFFVRDMAGMDVVLVGAEDVSIGRVVDVVTAENERQGLANDLLEIELLNMEGEEEEEKGKAPREAPAPTYLVLVPFVRQIVPIVDMAGRTLHIDPPPGLLDLAYKKEERVVVRGALPPQSQFSPMQEVEKNARGRKRRRVAVKRTNKPSSLPCEQSVFAEEEEEDEEEEGGGL